MKGKKMDDQKEVMKVVISIKQDGRMNVTGFPINLQQAQQVMHAAYDVVMNYFLSAAKKGNLDDIGTVVNSNIKTDQVKPTNKINTLHVKE
jgi:hypothetical protein